MKIQEIIAFLSDFWSIQQPLDGFSEIDCIELIIDAPLPADYKYFLQWFSNGGESLKPLKYLSLFPITEILEIQKQYEVTLWAPNLLIFASEGDDAFFFDLSTNIATFDYRIVSASLCSRDKNEVEIVGNCFSDFLARFFFLN